MPLFRAFRAFRRFSRLVDGVPVSPVGLNPGEEGTGLAATPVVQILSGLAWLDDVAALPDVVRASMAEAHRHWLLSKPRSYFEGLLTGATGLLIGALVRGELAGFAALVASEDFASARRLGQVTYPDPEGRANAAYGQGRVGVVQSLCVRRDYLGRALAGSIIRAAVEESRRQGRGHIFAQMADQNALSWMRFLGEGFGLVGTWETDCRRFLMRWFPPEERAAMLADAGLADRRLYRKDYGQIPALVADARHQVEAGRIVLLHDRPEEPGALHVVFCRAPSKGARSR